jgi:glutamate synthase domain-containing protein 3
VLASLAGEIALREHEKHVAKFHRNGNAHRIFMPYTKTIMLAFTGSAGQGFGVFMTDHLRVKLFGEANDSVCKSMSGGKMVICPPPRARFRAEKNVIIGNCALYGATGGTLYVNGIAGDRFAVRNSSALAVVEGVGLHACEYMTNGTVIILGEASYNLGSGMTGGTLYLCQEKAVAHVNTEFLIRVEIEEQELAWLREVLADYLNETRSRTARMILSDWNRRKHVFKKFIPLETLAKREVEVILPEKQNAYSYS